MNVPSPSPGMSLAYEHIHSSESLTTSENVWREVEFESDVDHREMTRAYGCDDYLSKWLPSRKQQENDGSSPFLKGKLGKGAEREEARTLFKSPCHYIEGKKSRLKDNRIQHDSAKKTYFEAIKCSPMKLRQSLASFKRPKLDDNFTLKPDQNILNTQNIPNNSTDLSISDDSMESLPEKREIVESKTPKPRTSLEMSKDGMMALGSLCFRKSLPEKQYSETNYTPCNMIGGKLRKVHCEKDDVLLSGRIKQKELLVRCESIMIYPKVLVNNKQQTVTTKPDKPKTAWQDDCKDTSLTPRYMDTSIHRDTWLTPSSKTENSIRLPQLATKDQIAQVHNQKPSVKVSIDKDQHVIGSRKIQNSAATKIIIPFGEDELRELAEKKSKIASFSQWVVSPKTRSSSIEEQSIEGIIKMKETGPMLEKKGWVEASIRKAGKKEREESGVHIRKKYSGERDVPPKLRYLKESLKLNEQPHTTQRQSNAVHCETQHDMARKQPIATQYLTVTTPNSPLIKSRIPTGFETPEIFVGRENSPPKRTIPYRFSYSQRGVTEYTKGSDRISVKQKDCENNSGHKENLGLKIGGIGLLKTSLVGEERRSNRLVEDDGKKKVQFLLQKSRYFT